jgi:formate dehydrogenase subunit delta
MHIERLIKMANDIGDFFKAEPNRADAVAGIANHIQRFWEQRMREQILEYAARDGSELAELVREALKTVQVNTPRSAA